MENEEFGDIATTFETQKGEKLEKAVSQTEAGVSRSQSLKSFSTKSMKNSISSTSYSQQQLHEPRMERLHNGTQMTIGNHVVEIVDYMTDGGFAHIYKVKFLSYLNPIKTPTLQKNEVICLKKVIVQKQEGLNELQMEVDTMKKLSSCSKIVTYYDSAAIKRSLFDGSEIIDDNPNSGSVFDPATYLEVLIIMELCPNNSLLDYMNERLITKLSELEILTVMYDVTKAIYHMHSFGLIHKDIKIENVLVDKNWRFKLCDFGSTSKSYPIATTPQEIAYLSQDIYLHTTPQYRAPEMIDLYRSLPIDEKSDIWALGVFLYKLIFYITPFEMTGQFAILHSRYDIPSTKISPNLTNLIVIMLSENPSLRPNIYQVFLEVHSMLHGNKVAISSDIIDIYQQGPYDFNKYANYQSYLQGLQYNIVASYQQKKTIDEYMYLNVFEIAPKQPYNAGMNFGNKSESSEKVVKDFSKSKESVVDIIDNELNSQAKNAVPATLDLKTGSLDVSQKIKVERSTGEILFNVSKEKPNFSGDKFDPETSHVENASIYEESDIYQRFPSVEDLTLQDETLAGTKIKKDETLQSSSSSEVKLNNTKDNVTSKDTGIGGLTSSLDKAITKHHTADNLSKDESSVKKYKSNNPFPKMASNLNGESFKKSNFLINDQFFSSSKVSLKNEKETLIAPDFSSSSYNKHGSSHLHSTAKTGSSVNSSVLQTHNGSQNMSPFLTSSIPSKTLSQKKKDEPTVQSSLLSTTTTKDLIDFSDIDIGSSALNSQRDNNVRELKKQSEVGDLRKKFKDQSPMLSGDDSTLDTTGSSMQIEETVKDPRIKKILQLRYTNIDLENSGKYSQTKQEAAAVLQPYMKKNNNVSQTASKGRKSLDFRRDIFTEDMDLTDSQESLYSLPEKEGETKLNKMKLQHSKSMKSSSASSTPVSKIRRSLDFEKEVQTAPRSMSKDDSAELVAELSDIDNSKNTSDNSTNISRQEKRKSLFSKFTKGF
ncbi:hypothetical protein QEN19_001013 [Hanseniaspora menglaensis]